MRIDLLGPAFPQMLLLATLVLLPFGVAPELPVLIGAVLGLVAMVRGRINWQRPGVRLAVVLGLGYWLPQFLSALDSVAASKSWMEVALDLRFLPFLLYLANARCTAREAQLLTGGIALVVLFWCADALLQVLTGYSMAGAASGDRLSGIFGAGNLKLGGVLAVLAPFAMVEAWRRSGWEVLALVTLALMVVILLAGARAAWFGFALGAAVVFWQVLGRRRALLAFVALALAAVLIGVAGYAGSERFALRVDRTAAVVAGDRAALDHALSGRLVIWETALRMGVAHPVNGVGVRAFRYAYPDFAAPHDQFLENGHGAYHAHQIVLELWSETGLVGLGIWLTAIILAWKASLAASTSARSQALPATIALGVALFPLNTHYAVYSGFWGLLLLWLIAVWLQLLSDDQS